MTRPAQKQPPVPTDKMALTIPEVERLSSLGETSIYKAIKDGKLKARKFGTRTLIMRPDLEAFLTALPEIN